MARRIVHAESRNDEGRSEFFHLAKCIAQVVIGPNVGNSFGRKSMLRFLIQRLIHRVNRL